MCLLTATAAKVTLTGVTNQGKVYTDLKNVAAKDEDGKWGATAFGTALKDSSILDESITSDVTLDEYKEIIGVLGNGVALHSANITTKDGGAISLDDANKVGSGDFGHAKLRGLTNLISLTSVRTPKFRKTFRLAPSPSRRLLKTPPAITSARIGSCYEQDYAAWRQERQCDQWRQE